MELSFLYVKQFFLRTARVHQSEQFFHSPRTPQPTLNQFEMRMETLRIKLIIN